MKTHLSSKELAELAGTSEQAIRKAVLAIVSGDTTQWRGAALKINVIEGSNTGRGGKTYQIAVDSLPLELQNKFHALIPTQSVVSKDLVPVTLIRKTPVSPASTKVVPTRAYSPSTKLAKKSQTANIAAFNPSPDDILLRDEQSAAKELLRARWIEALIKPVLSMERMEKGAYLKQLSQKQHFDWGGEYRELSLATLYGWIKLYQQGGVLALQRKTRTDTGRDKTLISYKWDTFAAAQIPEKAEFIAQETIQYIKSCWASGASSRTTISTLATKELFDLTQAALNEKYRYHTVDLKSICEVNRAIVAKYKHYEVVDIARNDAKEYYDHYQPSINRTIKGLYPNDIVVGDVHPIDIKLTRDDGSEVYARAISWFNVATHELMMVLIQLKKNEGVKRIHVAQAFSALVENWGLPKKLYLDNGKEYDWRNFTRSFNDLRAIAKDFQIEIVNDSTWATTDEQGIIRAAAYNAKAKAIEGVFGVFEEKYAPLIKGYVGGNRMKKKTHNMGKAPVGFVGTFEKFSKSMSEVITFYHNNKQRGQLEGRSPYDVLREFVDGGWKALQVKADTLMLSLAVESDRVVQGGGTINYTPKGKQSRAYQASQLIPFYGQHVKVRIPEHNPDQIFVQHPIDGKWIVAEFREFGYLDKAGIAESKRLKKEARRVVQQLSRDCYRLDLEQETEEYNNSMDEPPAISFAATIDHEATKCLTQAIDTKQRQAKIIPIPKKTSVWGNIQPEEDDLDDDDDSTAAATG